MDITALRALSLDVSCNVYGVPATLYPAGDDTKVTATGIWLTPLLEEMPIGRDFQRREPRRVLAFRVAEVGDLPRGTVIQAAEHGGELRSWRVDTVDKLDAEQIRVVVVPIPC